MITDTKQKALEQEMKKKEYEENTTKLRQEIDQQKEVNVQKKDEYSQIKEKNKEIKGLLDNKEKDIQEKKEYLRRLEIDQGANEKQIKELKN